MVFHIDNPPSTRPAPRASHPRHDLPGSAPQLLTPIFSCLAVAAKPTEVNSEKPLVRRAYAVIEKLSFLDWGLTSSDDVSCNSERPRRAPPSRDAQSLPSSKTQRAATAVRSEAYFELTKGSNAKWMHALVHLREQVLCTHAMGAWSAGFDLGPHSSFLDLGSGYGKVVLHLASSGLRLQHVCGIECVRSRHAIAEQALAELRAAPKSELQTEPQGSGSGSIADCCTARTRSGHGRGKTDGGNDPRGGVPRTPPQPFHSVTFLHGCADEQRILPFTHIYMSDSCFSQSTIRGIALVLQRSPFYVLVSHVKADDWWDAGLFKVQPVARISGLLTTGGEGLTCFIYINMEHVR
jgi:hypothetical protein